MATSKRKFIKPNSTYSVTTKDAEPSVGARVGGKQDYMLSQYYRDKRQTNAISGILNTGSAVAPGPLAYGFDAASLLHNASNNDVQLPDVVLPFAKNVNYIKPIRVLGKAKTVNKILPLGTFGRVADGIQAVDNFNNAYKYNDSLNMIKSGVIKDSVRNTLYGNGGRMKRYDTGGPIELDEFGNLMNAYQGFDNTTGQTSGKSLWDSTKNMGDGKAGSIIGVGVPALTNAFIPDKNANLNMYEEYHTDYGRKGVSGALNGAAQGFKTAGPIGALAGAVVGGVTSAIGARRAEKKHNQEVGLAQNMYRENMQQGQLYDNFKNQNYFNDTRGAQMYGNGGPIARPLQPLPPLTIPTADSSYYFTGLRNEQYANQADAVTPQARQSAEQKAAYYDQQLNRQHMKALPGYDANGFPLKNGYVSRANGGELNPELQEMEQSPNMNRIASNTLEVNGPSHEEGGVDVPGVNAEVEGKETIADIKGEDSPYVFSEQLGFAKIHKQLAKTREKIEHKPATPERLNALRLIDKKEQRLKNQQEQVKQQLNLQ
jgi:hypothetical protein